MLVYAVCCGPGIANVFEHLKAHTKSLKDKNSLGSFFFFYCFLSGVPLEMRDQGDGVSET